MDVKNRAKELLREGKVNGVANKESEISYTVGDYYVRIFRKPGRTLLSCSCENHSRFCNEQPFCKHKLAREKLKNG